MESVYAKGGLFRHASGALPQTPRFFALKPTADMKQATPYIRDVARALWHPLGARVAPQQSPVPQEGNSTVHRMCWDCNGKDLI